MAIRNRDDCFDQFWSVYPMKVGKMAAHRAYHRILRQGATPQDVIDGVLNYIAHKPDYASYCYPTTFLNQGRWLDEYTDDQPLSPEETRFAQTVMRKRLGRCHHSPPCPDALACLNAIAYELRAKGRQP